MHNKEGGKRILCFLLKPIVEVDRFSIQNKQGKPELHYTTYRPTNTTEIPLKDEIQTFWKEEEENIYPME